MFCTNFEGLLILNHYSEGSLILVINEYSFGGFDLKDLVFGVRGIDNDLMLKKYISYI